MRRAISACFAIVFLIAPLQAEDRKPIDYRWSFRTDRGGFSAVVKNKDGATFVISCTLSGGGEFSIYVNSQLVKAEKKTDIQIVVKDESFPFEMENQFVYIDRRINEGNFLKFVDALKKTTEPRFTVELPATQNEISFSTLEAKKWLTGLLDGCLADAPKTSVSVAESFIGKWYVQDAKECRLRPGESAELVSYTQDRVVGPEISCKIVRAVPRGPAGTELDLMCDGEGRRGVRMKEVVQVVNGRLQVGTDKYLRCP